MAKHNGFGVRPGARISAQQVVLIAVSVLALVLMITTLTAFNSSSDAAQIQDERYDKLLARFDDEISAIDIMLSQQETEAGEARIHTLQEIVKHIYAADALSIYKVDAFGGEPLITTDVYSYMTELMAQGMRNLQSGNRPDEQIAEFAAALEKLKTGEEEAA